MAKILTIYAHPDYERSIANKAVLEEFTKLVPVADIVNLAKTYPDYKIDIKNEQERLKAAEMVIFQYPFWFFGAPSLMHYYLEKVFAYGFAYGPGAGALKGKNLALSFTIGGSEGEYQRREGLMHTVEQFLPAMLETAAYCGMIYRGAVYAFDMMADKDDQKSVEAVKARAKDQAERLAKHIGQFVSLK